MIRTFTGAPDAQGEVPDALAPEGCMARCAKAITHRRPAATRSGGHLDRLCCKRGLMQTNPIWNQEANGSSPRKVTSDDKTWSLP